MYQYYIIILFSHSLIIVRCRNNISKMSTQLFNVLLHSVTAPVRLSQAEYCHVVYEEVLDHMLERMAVALVVLQTTQSVLLFLISILSLLSIPCHSLPLQLWEFLPAFFLCCKKCVHQSLVNLVYYLCPPLFVFDSWHEMQ